MSSNRPLTIAISGTALVVMTACGGSSTTPTATTSSSSSAASPSSSAASGPTGPATIKIATTSLGKVLVDDQGRSLYMFSKDKGDVSSCYGECEAAWPPALTSGAPVAGTGADKDLLGTTTRKDGTSQVTYKTYPLYRFTPDAKAGDVKGQGVKNIWWVVDHFGRPKEPATVDVANTKFGKVITDGRDFSLYMFTKDKNGKSVCYGECEAKWPPLLTTGTAKAGTGADAKLLGTTTRTDGTKQVTYNKLPVYYFTPDKKPGDLNGQAVGTVWWLVSDKGAVVKKAS